MGIAIDESNFYAGLRAHCSLIIRSDSPPGQASSTSASRNTFKSSSCSTESVTHTPPGSIGQLFPMSKDVIYIH